MKNYIVLDIDRTIIKGTSWYHACKCDNLLIAKDNIPLFDRLNTELFTNGNEKSREQFRIETFNLIEKKITKEGLELLNSEKIENNFPPGEYINDEYFKLVGKYTLKKLVNVDNDCITFLMWLYRLFFGKVTFLFLTSGYTQYMKGLIEEYVGLLDEKIEWEVIGSDLSIESGVIKLTNVITQKKKYDIVQNIILGNNHIAFLADDSLDELRLFEIVNENGGYAFKVQYSQHEKKLNWDELIKKVRDKECLYKYLVNNSSIRIDSQNSIIKESKMKSRYNQIGILCYSSDEFGYICDTIGDRRINEEIEKFIFRKGNNIYLRGELYYYWLPKYINLSSERKIDGWKRNYYSTLQLYKLLLAKKEKSKYDYIVAYIVSDYLLSALYLLLYCIEEERKKKQPVDIEDYLAIKEAILIANNVIFDILCGRDFLNYFEKLEAALDGIKLSDLYLINMNEKYMLELDDYSTIFSFACNIVKKMGEKLELIDGVISLAYGSTALGYAIKIVIDKYRSEPIKLFSSHFSYRKHNNIASYIENEAEYDEMQEIKCEESLLVVDNNVTTFETLSSIKKYLTGKGKKVLCAVPEIDYNNICRWLQNEKKVEVLCDNWFETLDFLPIKPYVTAYDTWGTSEKSKLLEKLFIKNNISFKVERKENKGYFFEHRKICRVHNIYDMQLAIDMGATMIGVHAVVSNKKKYYEQNETSKIEKKYPDLPVCDYEIDSINHMISILPSNITPILIVEKKQTVENIERIIALYGMKISESGIQLQFEADSSYISKLIKMGFASVIISIGVTQSDKREYLNNVKGILRKDRDYILVDMSKHQPQLISNGVCNEDEILSFGEKYDKLDEIIYLLKGDDYRVLLADDICPSEFLLLQLKLASNNVNVVGLDMQNNIEEKKEKQKFSSIYNGEKEYMAKIRKSVDKVSKWMIYEFNE
jgi:phosphoribosylanthranilate isomerase